MAGPFPFPSTIPDWLAWVFCRFQSNGTLLPGEPNVNFLSPLTATDNPGNRSIDIGFNGSVLAFGGIITSSGAILGNTRVGFNSSQFAAGSGPSIVLPGGAADGTLVAIGDIQGAANTNPAQITSADLISVQNPQGPGFVFGDGVHLWRYIFDESATWRMWMHFTDNSPGGRGAFWGAVQ